VKDLSESFPLLQAVVKHDPELETSFVVQKFFPVLFKKRAQAPAADKFCVNVSFLIRSA
jgi:hypothetical protein